MFIVTYIIGAFLGMLYFNTFNFYSIILIALGGIGELFLHMMTNIINDYYDYLKNIDKEENIPPKRFHLIFNTSLNPKQVRNIAISLGSIALIIGILIAIMNRPIALILGLIGFLIGLEYSSPPFYLKYKGLGDFSVIISMLLLSLAGFYLTTGKISIIGILIGIPISLLIDDVLMANNIRDIKRDNVSNTKTLPILLGYEKSKILYIIFILISYLVLGILIGFKLISIIASLEFLTIPQAIILLSDAMKNNFEMLDVKTAKLVLNFGIILAISFIISYIIKI